MLMLRFHPSQADEHGGQHGEDHGLDETYQALKTHHKDAHQYAQCRHGELDGYGLTCHQEDDASDSHGNSVTCHHVGKKTNHQRKGLCEDSHKLNDGNDGNRSLQPGGHFGPEDFFPVVLVSRELYDDKRAERQEENGIKPITLHVKMKKKQVSR